MITNDNSPKWEVFREIPVDMDPPPQTSSMAASSSTSAGKGAVAPPLQLRSPMLRPSVLPEVRMGLNQRAFKHGLRVKPLRLSLVIRLADLPVSMLHRSPSAWQSGRPSHLA